MDASQDLHHALAQFARDMLQDDTTPATVGTITQTVLGAIENVDAAAVSILHKRERMETLGATADWVGDADRLQYDLDEGPCMDAVLEHEVVRSPDLAAEERWSHWAPAVVARFGVRSMLCVQLFVHDRHVGALNLYSRTPEVFTFEDVAEATMYAAQAAVAVASMQEIQQLKSAVASRTVIGQAEGILMERFDLDGDQAFAVLRRLSQHLNRKLLVIAQELVTTRVLPETD